MTDGSPDGWTGLSIPVCVLAAGATQQENSVASAAGDETLMKERDYIGLGLAAPEQELCPQNVTAQSAKDKMECDNVELSLGLSFPDSKSPQQAPHVEQPVGLGSHPDVVESQAKLKLASPGAKPQNFWHHSFRVSLSNEHLQAEANNGASLLKNYAVNVPAWGIVPGRFTIPVPKVSTVPAKRSYLEAVGERRSLPTSSTSHAVAGEAASPCAIMPAPTGTVHAWNGEPVAGSASLGGGWKAVHARSEQGTSHLAVGSGASCSFAHSRQLAAVPPPPPPHFKVPQASMGTPLPLVPNPPTAPNGVTSSSQAVEASVKPEIENDNRNKLPMVGWPPVRSFRKNTLQAAQNSSEDLHMKSAAVGPSSGGVDGLEPNGNNGKTAFFVKAKLDGVRICRKVDLQAYNSYDSLKSALQEMFQGFVSDNAKLDLLHGNNYVVTHEDKDGDCLLVGDVPWPMFVESNVKSLRIMKAMDANGIGEKASAKLKAQVNGKP